MDGALGGVDRVADAGAPQPIEQEDERLGAVDVLDPIGQTERRELEHVLAAEVQSLTRR